MKEVELFKEKIDGYLIDITSFGTGGWCQMANEPPQPLNFRRGEVRQYITPTQYRKIQRILKENVQ